MTNLALVEMKQITVYLYMWGENRDTEKSGKIILILLIELGRERRISRGTEGEGEIRRLKKCAKFGLNSFDQS